MAAGLSRLIVAIPGINLLAGAHFVHQSHLERLGQEKVGPIPEVRVPTASPPDYTVVTSVTLLLSAAQSTACGATPV